MAKNRNLFSLIFFIWFISSALISIIAAFHTYISVTKALIPDINGLGHYSSERSVTVISADNTTMFKQIFFFGGRLLPSDNIEYAMKLSDLIRKNSENIEYPVWYRFLMKYHGISSDGLDSYITEYYARSLINASKVDERRKKLLKYYTLRRLKGNYSDEEMYRMFFDSVHFGENVQGFAGAAKAFFNKEYSQLSPLELSYIVLKASVAYHDYDKLARQYVHEMYVTGELSLLEYRLEIGKRLVFASHVELKPDAIVSYVLKDALKQLKLKRFDKKIEIYTYYNLSTVKLAESVLKKRLEKDRRLQAGFIFINTLTGGIEATVGSRYPGSFNNRALSQKRQMGSIFKPIVYTAAFEKGVLPSSIVEDKRYIFFSGNTEYSPRNYKDRFFGKIPLRYGLVYSLNNTTVLLAKNIGLNYMVKTAYAMGFEGVLSPYLSTALGSFETTPLNVAKIYSTLASSGKKKELTFISHIMRDGDVAYTNSLSSTEVISAEAAYQTLYIMQDVPIYGTAKNAGFLPGTAVKTGTTDKSRDYWTVTVTPPYVTVLWLGYDDNSPVNDNLSAGSVAAPLVADFHRVFFKEGTAFHIEPPPGIVFKKVRKKTGLLTDKNGDVYLEAFKKDNLPLSE